jgi:acyl-CoA thioester hydrolase
MGQPFILNERVRWIDCDAAQIIYYGAYVRFFEIAETEMYRSVNLPYATAFKTLNCFPIRATFHCDFKSPALLDDLMAISLWVSHWGTTSFTISFRFLRAGTDVVLAEGFCRLVTVSLDEKKKRPIPDLLRESLQCYTVLPSEDVQGS